MEDTLRVKLKLEQIYQNGLNPCFNGRYSQRDTEFTKLTAEQVLILVLMEDTLRVDAALLF